MGACITISGCVRKAALDPDRSHNREFGISNLVVLLVVQPPGESDAYPIYRVKTGIVVTHLQSGSAIGAIFRKS